METPAHEDKTIRRMMTQEALDHLLMKVGDATAVGPAELVDGLWRVPVYLSYRDVWVGHLVFDSEGHLLLDRSDTQDQMLARANEALGL